RSRSERHRGPVDGAADPFAGTAEANPGFSRVWSGAVLPSRDLFPRQQLRCLATYHQETPAAPSAARRVNSQKPRCRFACPPACRVPAPGSCRRVCPVFFLRRCPRLSSSAHRKGLVPDRQPRLSPNRNPILSLSLPASPSHWPVSNPGGLRPFRVPFPVHPQLGS